jgi:hypothetical protein
MTKAAHIERPFVFRPKIPEISSTIFIYRMEHPEPLIFPLGVRFPRDDEFPAAHEHQRDRIARARITTGYVLREQQDHSFQAFFEANVHAQALWSTFHVLSDILLPDVAAPIIGVKDDKPRWPNIIEQVQLAFEALPRRKAP